MLTTVLISKNFDFMDENIEDIELAFKDDMED